MLLCSPAAANAVNERDAVYAIAMQAVDGLHGRDLSHLRGAIWRDGYHTIDRRDQNGEVLTRHWDEVPFGSVNVRDRRGKPSISIRGDRADVRVPYTYRVYYGIEDRPVECGSGAYRFDLRRRGGEWRVLNMTDMILQSGDRCE